MIGRELKKNPGNCHAQPAEKILSLLETEVNGLTEEEVHKRQATLGLNHIPEKAKDSMIIRFLRHFNNILIYVLLFAALITASLNHWVDTFVILAVVIINACIGFIQEGKAEKALDAIRQMLSPTAAVLRDDKRQTIPAN